MIYVHLCLAVNGRLYMPVHVKQINVRLSIPIHIKQSMEAYLGS